MSSNVDERSIDSAYHFAAPCCTMCDRIEKAQSFCITCSHYLCEQCDLAHKIIVCFNSHRIVSEVGSVDQLERTINGDPQNARDFMIQTCKETLERIFWQGTSCVNKFLKLAFEREQSVELLTEQRADALSKLNELHGRLQDCLTLQKDRIAQSLQEEFLRRERLLISQKHNFEQFTNSLLLKLADIQMFIDNVNNNPDGLDLRRIISEGYFDDMLAHIAGLEDVGNEAAACVPLDKDAFPFDLLNPVVAQSESSSMMSSVTPPTNLSLTDPEIPPHTCNVSTIQIYKTFGQKGAGPSQFNSPHGFCIGHDEDIVVADSSNHRIQIFDKSGRFKRQFGMAGRHDGYLWHPRKVAFLPEQRRYVVCDRGYERSRMQLFTETGQFIKKVYIQYIDIVAGMAVTESEQIVVVNSVTPTVFVIGDNDFLRSIDCSGFMEEPSDITVVGKEFYICDFKAHSIVVMDEDGNLLRRFGNKQITTYPNGIAVSANGYVLVGDSHGNFFHVVVYTTDGIFVSQYRCPYVKVSRCCGLKITSESRIITVDKNYHHVLMLEAPFVSS